jgi:hypothetical protein
VAAVEAASHWDEGKDSSDAAGISRSLPFWQFWTKMLYSFTPEPPSLSANESKVATAIAAASVDDFYEVMTRERPETKNNAYAIEVVSP